MTTLTMASNVPAQPSVFPVEDVEVRGHIIDSLILPKILDCISGSGGSFRIKEITIGQARNDPSQALIEVRAEDQAVLDGILAQIADHGAMPTAAQRLPARRRPTSRAPFPKTSIARPTSGPRSAWPANGSPSPIRRWIAASSSTRRTASPAVLPMNETRVGDAIVVGHAGVRVFPEERSRGPQTFEFMGSNVSTEKPKKVAIRQIAQELAENRAAGGKTVVVAGPAVVHTGSGEFL